MCGIFGALRLDGRDAGDLAPLVKRGVQCMLHRGPDGVGVESRGQACLGHARLAIIDLAGGAQPMTDVTGQGFIAYNGEVYNFRELKAELETLGRRFHSHCDTEVVLNAYLEWGAQCVERLRGMFAFTAVDFRTNTALIARDRLGVKPAYYVERDGALWFSSEIEPLYRTVGPFDMSLEALDDYLWWQYIHAPATIYQDVLQLPPAHCLEVDLTSGRVTRSKYWTLTFREDRSLSLEDWIERLDALVREAVSIRLVSDVPFGAFLSGGIDSSLVVGYMAEIMREPVKTFSIGFEETDFSELSYAEQAAALNKTDHRVEIVKADSLGLLPLLARHYGQPFADSSAIPTYYVSRMARKHVTMVLTGDGGDENFAGYHSYEHVIAAMCPELHLKGLGPQVLARRLARFFLNKWQQASMKPVDMAYALHCQTSHHFAPGERRGLFRRGLQGVVRNHQPARRALMDLPGAPLVSRLQHLDLMAYLPQDILTKVDIASMANSLETRVPLLDHILVETAATMPASLKLREERAGGRTLYEKKYALKLLARRRYPESFVNRPKMGFGVPIGRWFAGPLREQMRQRLLGSQLLPRLFDMDAVRSIVDTHSVQNDLQAKLWNLLFLEEWMCTHEDALPAH